MTRKLIEQKKKEWENSALKKVLDKNPERKEHFTTNSWLEAERVALPPDMDERQWLEKIGFPGEYPYTRGVQPTMYRGRFWTMRQYAGFGTAEESNRRYKYLLEQ